MYGQGGEVTRLAALRQALGAHGLHVRGAFAAAPPDRLPPLADGASTAAVVLVGNVGSSKWHAFLAAPEARDGLPDPLDRWSCRIGDAIAPRFGARAVYPFGGPPHYPFQRWAARAEGLHGSPLGLLIHPEYGLWHAYRFALLLPGVPADLSRHAPHDSPCVSCFAKPCLRGCPVGAFSTGAYDAHACGAHLDAQPDGECGARGCLARRACPLGTQHQYQPAHARFHMRAYVGACRARSRHPGVV